MPIQHKNINSTFNDNFQTHNAILDTTPYKPEVMIIGTFNPDTPHANFSDFFYGRNYFWPAFKNLFVHNNCIIINRRMPANGAPQFPLNPTLHEILDLCIKLKLCFSDLILEVLNHNNPIFHLLPNDHVIFNGSEYNLITDDGNNGLNGLNHLGQVKWNTNNIIDFLCKNPQVHSIYLTRRPIGIWGQQWNQIVNHPCLKGKRLTNIYTPSARALPGHPQIVMLIHHWLFNVNQNFGTLNNEWLVQNNVNLNNFLNIPPNQI